ncbi:MAG TPA: hypothetical protein VK190_02645 [Pseudoneobacillus sp.]|nr:hypothetical protein [Pseudoneobacillus sp.]
MAFTWSKENCDFLIANYNSYSNKELAEKMNTTESSIAHKAKRLGLKKEIEQISSETKLFLEQNYMVMTYEEMRLYLDLNSIDQIKYLLQKLNLKKQIKWTKEDEQYVIDNYKIKSDFEIGNALGKTATSILKKRMRLGLNRPDNKHIVYNKAEKDWKDDEIEYLKDHYNNTSIRKIAMYLDRPEKGIQIKASRLRIANQRFKTQPETEVECILEELKLKYVPEFPYGPYTLDFYIPDKIVVEVHGDFWHCNPLIYKDGPISPIQEKNIENDKRKKDFLETQGFKVIYIWQSELSNLDLVKEMLAPLASNCYRISG